MSFVSWKPSRKMIRRCTGKMTGEKFNGHTSRENGQGQFVGNMVEAAFYMWLRKFLTSDEVTYVADNMEFHDFVVCGCTFDAKAKERTVPARPDYHCNVETRIKDKPCQYYVFGSVTKPEGVDNYYDTSRVELLGYLPKRDFWELPRDDDGKPDKFPSHKILHSRLRSMDDLKDNLEALAYRMAFGEVYVG